MVRGMDAKSVDLCFAGVVELSFPCLHARPSPMRLVGENWAPWNFDVGDSAEEYFRHVSSEQYCSLLVQWIQWIKSLKDFYFRLVLDTVHSFVRLQTVMASQGRSILSPL